MGSGFKDFAAGDVLTANDVDGYLMRQTVMTFADASARDTALSGVLDEGMMAYLEDTNLTTYYDGSNWRQQNGRVLQVVSSVYSTSTSVTGISYVSTGLSASITPTSSSSLVLVTVNHPIEVSAGGFLYVKLTQNGASQAVDGDILYNATYPRGYFFNMVRLLSPASTSALTYATEFRCPSGTAIVQPNGNDSTITLMEIAG